MIGVDRSESAIIMIYYQISSSMRLIEPGPHDLSNSTSDKSRILNVGDGHVLHLDQFEGLQI